MKNCGLYLFTFLVVITLGISNAQPIDNLSRINLLIDNSINSIDGININSSAYYNIHAPNNYKILQSRAELTFGKHGLREQSEKEFSSESVLVKYRIDFAGVKYHDLHRDGLFGSYYLEREVSLKGYYLIQKENRTVNSDEFLMSTTDTISYKDITSYENPSLPFTQSEIPTEPFWSGITEPVIAIVTVVVTLLLFFTVRSK